uniref:Uncharacterized protein n=1 Tax=Ditylenchus dipsaci TaxID=166011 RepID=A0A915EF38_9BILA
MDDKKAIWKWTPMMMLLAINWDSIALIVIWMGMTWAMSRGILPIFCWGKTVLNGTLSQHSCDKICATKFCVSKLVFHLLPVTIKQLRRYSSNYLIGRCWNMCRQLATREETAFVLRKVKSGHDTNVAENDTHFFFQ